MMSLIDYAILSFTSLFVIVDPVGLIPTFLAMTGQNTLPERIRMAQLATGITCSILLLSFFLGQRLLAAFGISLPAFQIAGGIILLIVALDMLQARRTAFKETQEEKAEGIDKNDVAVTPMAIPMLAGPGAITAVILLSDKATTLSHQGILVAAIVLVSLLTLIILRLAATCSKVISGIGLRIITRLMGLILAAIAVQFVLSGITAAHLFS